MATIRKRKTKSGYYVVDFTYKGRRYVLTTKTKSKRVAKRILQDIEARIALGIFNIRITKTIVISLKTSLKNILKKKDQINLPELLITKFNI
jgi:hypothetical protein